MALDGLLDFPVRSSPQGLQQLVSMLEVVFVVMFLYAGAAAPEPSGLRRGPRRVTRARPSRLHRPGVAYIYLD